MFTNSGLQIAGALSHRNVVLSFPVGLDAVQNTRAVKFFIPLVREMGSMKIQ